MKETDKRGLIERQDAGEFSPEEFDEAFREVIDSCKGDPKPFLEFPLAFEEVRLKAQRAFLYDANIPDKVRVLRPAKSQSEVKIPF